MPDVNIGRLPFSKAIEFLRNKEAVPTEAYTDLLHEQHDNAFVVAGLTKVEVLSDIQKSLVAAMENGTPFEQWRKKDFERIIEGHWVPCDKRTGEVNTGWRARLIYETNMRTAYAAGEYQQLQRVKKTHPFWRYRHGSPRKPRPEHVAWDGMVLRADDPWWETHYPPNGFGCGCYVEPVSRAEMEDLGKVGEDGKPKPDIPPPDAMRKVKYGGREIEVPKGVDPGWAYTPGKSLADVAKQSLAKAPPELAEKLRAEMEAKARAEAEAKAAEEAKAAAEAEARAKAEAEAKAAEEAQTKENAARQLAAWQTSPETIAKAMEDAKAAAKDVITAARAEASAKAKAEAEAEIEELGKEAERRKAAAIRANERASEAQEKADRLADERLALYKEFQKNPGDAAKKEEWRKKAMEASKADAVARHKRKLADNEEKAVERAVEHAQILARGEALRPYVEPALYEVFDATGVEIAKGIKFSTPKFGMIKDAIAEFNTRSKVMTVNVEYAERYQNTETQEYWDGSGYLVDPKTLKRLVIPSKDQLKTILTHELAHDMHGPHSKKFQEWMYDLLSKWFPNFFDYPHVYCPPSTDYEKGAEHPKRIKSEKKLGKMVEELKRQQEMEKKETGKETGDE